MAHEYHDALPGYHPDQLLVDGCPECERRAASATHGIAQLDSDRFERAWLRAAEVHMRHVEGTSEAEFPMLSAMWAVQVAFERRGVAIGDLPDSVGVPARRLQRDVDLRRLKKWRDELPDGHADKPGAIRAVEVLRYLPINDPIDPADDIPPT